MVMRRTRAHALELANADVDFLDTRIVGKMWCERFRHVQPIVSVACKRRDDSGSACEMIGVVLISRRWRGSF
jgi:hypothetical protein